MTISGRTKRMLKGTRETMDQLYIDQDIFKEAKTRRENVSMDCQQTYKLSDKVLDLITNAKEKLKGEIDNEETNRSKGKNPKRLALSKVICYYHEATQLRN